MNFKDQLFHSSPLFSSNNILKFGDKITSENILFISKSINRQALLYLMIGLHSQETYIGMKLVGRQLTILIFQLFKPKNMVILVYIGASAIHSWNYTQDMLKTNLSLQISTPTNIKYFLTKYFIESY